jgi:predicted PurR-regulated permease PerM
MGRSETMSSPEVRDQRMKDALPVEPAPANPELVPSDAAEDVELLQATVKIGVIAQVVVAAIATIGLLYLLKLVLVPVLLSAFIAFILEPGVAALERIHIPRVVGAMLAVLILFGVAGVGIYYFSNRAIEFVSDLPKYSRDIRKEVSKIQEQTQKIEDSTRSIVTDGKGPKPVPVEMRQGTGLAEWISSGAMQYGEALLAASFVPFLIFFMLTWKAHVHSTTVKLFPREHRLVAHRTIGRISKMIRSFIVANLIVGLIGAVISIAVFWRLGLPYFYFLGAISAFVGLIPYLGVFFALLVPLAGGLGHLGKSEVLYVFLTVVGLHLVTMNVLYPRVVGRRLRLNPLAVALSLLFWAWIWGAVGLILAVPLVGAAKITCDYIGPLQGLGEWLGD